jgi:hypothetical protein
MGHFDDTTRQRIAKLLAMLGSDNEGERTNALTLIDRTLKAQGKTWVDLANKFFGVTAAKQATWWDFGFSEATKAWSHAEQVGREDSDAFIDKALKLATGGRNHGVPLCPKSKPCGRTGMMYGSCCGPT